MNILTLRRRAPKWEWTTSREFGVTEYDGCNETSRVMVYRYANEWWVDEECRSHASTSRLEDWLAENGGGE